MLPDVDRAERQSSFALCVDWRVASTDNLIETLMYRWCSANCIGVSSCGNEQGSRQLLQGV